MIEYVRLIAFRFNVEEVQSNFHVSMYFVIMHQDRDASRQLAIIMYVKEILSDAATSTVVQ